MQTVKIDFVSDVVCPWCVIGLKSLEAALASLSGEIQAEITFRPFELNPQMAPQGENIEAHLVRKYQLSPQQMADNQATIAARGKEVGFDFNLDGRHFIYNTFDAHRLLAWAHDQGKQHALKLALFKAYFSDGGDPSNHEQLLALVEQVGLDVTDARAILDSDRYGQQVRQEEAFYQQQGISAVPAVILNGKYLISGGQPPAAFEQALRQVAQEG